MNRLKFLLASMALILLVSCGTSRSTVSKNVNLSRYEYASIVDNDTYSIPAELMEYEIQLYDAVEESNLKLVSDARIYELTPAQRDKLLLVKYGVNVEPESTVITVNFMDYNTGRPVVSCQGAYSSIGVSINGAIKQVAKKIKETFQGRN